MANKDLVRRAFSVTANLPVQKRDGQPAEVASPAEQTANEASGEPGQKPSAGAAGGFPKTGPGSMLAFMADQSEVHREVIQLREQLTVFEGAEVARRLDPKQISVSRWANRDEAHFQTEVFARLKAEIASAGGNVQPIKVRPLSGTAKEGAGRWEIVFGHRRHRACLELGIPVLAMIERNMKDVDLFVEMERENREREDLSAWEQGVMYMRALELGLFPSAKQMAAAIDRDMGNISRAMALAKLPSDVIRAFGSPLNLQFRWASPLKEAHQRDPEKLLAVARELAAAEPRLAPAEVFARLSRPEGPESGAKEGVVAWTSPEGHKLASLTTDRKGRATISFEVALDPAQREKLVTLMDGFLGLKG